MNIITILSEVLCKRSKKRGLLQQLASPTFFLDSFVAENQRG